MNFEQKQEKLHKFVAQHRSGTAVKENPKNYKSLYEKKCKELQQLKIEMQKLKNPVAINSYMALKGAYDGLLHKSKSMDDAYRNLEKKIADIINQLNN
jgi:hypothetical protein